MKRKNPYGQFCPVALAAQIVAERWTPLVLREILLGGSHRFNDIHRGVPLMSTSLLSKRLKDLERAGLIARREIDGESGHGYFPTPAGEALAPVIESLGEWGHRFVRSTFDDDLLDASLLLWDIRRCALTERMPAGRAVVQFVFPDEPGAKRRWWLVKEPGTDQLDLCLHDPGHEVDLVVTSDLRTMTRIWMGDLEIPLALRAGVLKLEGSPALRLSFQDWIGLSIFAHVEATAG
jgi:DNA-binding HxlR family transcriptional regulator